MRTWLSPELWTRRLKNSSRKLDPSVLSTSLSVATFDRKRAASKQGHQKLKFTQLDDRMGDTQYPALTQANAIAQLKNTQHVLTFDHITYAARKSFAKWP